MLANKLRVFTTKEELWVSQLHLVAVFIIIIMKPPRARYIIWRRYYGRGFEIGSPVQEQRVGIRTHCATPDDITDTPLLHVGE